MMWGSQPAMFFSVRLLSIRSTYTCRADESKGGHSLHQQICRRMRLPSTTMSTQCLRAPSGLYPSARWNADGIHNHRWIALQQIEALLLFEQLHDIADSLSLIFARDQQRVG